MTIHYLLDQYSGVIGDFALPALTPQAENNPIADKFSTSSVMNSKYPTEYYETQSRLKDNSGKTNATDEDKVLYKYFNSNDDDISELYAENREIQLLEMDNKQKREQIFENKEEINRLTKEKLDNLDTLKIDGNTATIGDKTYIKDSKGEWKELKESLPVGLSTNTYADYAKLLQATKAEYKERTGKDMPEKDQNKLLEAQDYTAKEKELLYSVTTGKDDNSYHALTTLTNNNISSDYTEFIKKSQNGDFSANGVNGAHKAKVLDFIEKSNLTSIERYYLVTYEGYAKDSLTKTQRDRLRQSLKDNRSNLKAETYESMIKKLNKAEGKDEKTDI